MNQVQISGTAKYIAGKAQETVGRFFGNKELQIRGLRTQCSGQAEKALGDAREIIKLMIHRVEQDHQHPKKQIPEAVQQIH